MYLIKYITLCENRYRYLTQQFFEKILIIMIERLLNFNTGSDMGLRFFYQFREFITLEGINLVGFYFKIELILIKRNRALHGI